MIRVRSERRQDQKGLLCAFQKSWHVVQIGHRGKGVIFSVWFVALHPDFLTHYQIRDEIGQYCSQLALLTSRNSLDATPQSLGHRAERAALAGRNEYRPV